MLARGCMENALPGPARPSPGEGFGPDCPGRAAGRPDVGMTRCSQNYCRPFRGISPSIQRPGVRWYAFLLHCPFLCLPLRPSSPRQSVHSLLLPPSPHPASRKRLDGTHAPPPHQARPGASLDSFCCLETWYRRQILPVSSQTPHLEVAWQWKEGRTQEAKRRSKTATTSRRAPHSSRMIQRRARREEEKRPPSKRSPVMHACMHACCFRRASVRAAAHSTCTWCMPDELSSQPGQGASSSRPHHARSCGCCAGQISVSGVATYIRYVDSARS